jgi:hypothetical protein
MKPCRYTLAGLLLSLNDAALRLETRKQSLAEMRNHHAVKAKPHMSFSCLGVER